jgi:hypothetical protein
MKKNLYLLIVLLQFFLTNAQPNPKFSCARESVFTKLFMYGNKDFYCNLSIINSLQFSNINNCFAINEIQIRDSLITNYFKIDVYKSLSNFFDDTQRNVKTNKMEFFLINFNRNDLINYYLEIPEFKKGIYFVDVSKKGTLKKVRCHECKDSVVNTIDITPQKWVKCKKLIKKISKSKKKY